MSLLENGPWGSMGYSHWHIIGHVELATRELITEELLQEKAFFRWARNLDGVKENSQSLEKLVGWDWGA